jgi:urease subunit alpha
MSGASVAAGLPDKLKLQKPIVTVKGCRSLGKADMINNTWLPKITVDPETYAVVADGELMTCEPAKVLPLAQRYFLF